jgi:hypothetical protein
MARNSYVATCTAAAMDAAAKGGVLRGGQQEDSGAFLGEDAFSEEPLSALSTLIEEGRRTAAMQREAKRDISVATKGRVASGSHKERSGSVGQKLTCVFSFSVSFSAVALLRDCWAR